MFLRVAQYACRPSKSVLSRKFLYTLHGIHYNLTFQKEKIPRLHNFKIPQLAFNQKSKTKLGRQRFALPLSASLAMSIYVNLIKSSGYFSL